VLKNSLFISNGQNLGDSKCLAIGEDRSYRILTQFHFRDCCRNEFFNSHEQCEQMAGLFYRVGEMQALRDVGNLGLGGVA